MLTTIDGLLDRRIKIEQPKEGYRTAVDTVLLAAAVPAGKGDRILDLGCGVGGGMLCLACRVPDVTVTGIEIQSELVALSKANIERNGMQDRLNVIEGDVLHPDKTVINKFDYVMMNPPYHDEARHDASANTNKRLANTEREGDLAQWISTAAQALKESGHLTLIHRADRLEEIIEKMKQNFGRIIIKPIAPRLNAAPKRILIGAKKGAPFTQETLLPFILHNTDGKYTSEAEKILRAAHNIDLSPHR